MIHFDCVTKEDINKHNRSWSQNLDHPTGY